MAAAAVQPSIILLPTSSEPQVASVDAASDPKPHHVHTVLNYYKDPGDGSPAPPTYTDRPQTGFARVIDVPVTIRDVRGHEAEYTLDKDGFQFRSHVATEKDFLDDGQIKARYYPEVEQLLKDVTGGSRIFIFDHTIRRQAAQGPGAPEQRGPLHRVHIDQSYRASRARVAQHLPDEAEALLQGRVQLVNVWRPIGTVRRDPLAVARAGSVAEADLVPTALVYPNRRGETYQVRPSPAHEWFYKSAMSPREVLLIKCFDSKTDGRARRVPHSAFEDPETEPDVPARESIEVRALVFHPDDKE